MASACSGVHDVRSLPLFLRSACRLPPNGILTIFDELDDLPLDPEKLRYLRDLIATLYEARAIVASYNIVVLALIFVFAFVHWRETRRDRREWRARTNLPEAPEGSASSSSSSTIQGTNTPPDAVKDYLVDMERVPLIARTKPPSPKRGGISRALSSWLAHQPPPLPVVNRTLPCNETSLFIAAWVLLNIFVHFYRLPMRWDYFFIFADRAGLIFIVNLPLLYLLGAKNQPLRGLTGRSYEALNIFHRRVGEWMCFEAAVHFISMAVWQFVLVDGWLRGETSPKAYWMHPIILCGIGALVSYELLFFTSLGTFRQRWYELFLASHVFLQAAALVFLWFHFYTSRPYVVVSLVIFVVDRFVWRFRLKRSRVTADLSILDDGETYLVSADWDIPRPCESKSLWWRPSFLQRRSVAHGWQPTDHVFLTVPALGRSFGLQAHPFTIASAAPQASPNATDHAWLSLLVRSHTGFTAELLHYAQSHSRVPIVLDGPYGSSYALDMLRASGCAILVAGGSGIAVTFPLVWALLHDSNAVEDSTSGIKTLPPRQRVHMLWVTHSRSHRSWIPEQQLDELVARGLDLVVPEPTAEAGRPDVGGLVNGWMEEAAVEGRSVGVVVSGPDGLNRTARNVCAEAMGRGVDVRVAVEKFGW
jgi:hypothetical protein